MSEFYNQSLMYEVLVDPIDYHILSVSTGGETSFQMNSIMSDGFESDGAFLRFIIHWGEEITRK